MKGYVHIRGALAGGGSSGFPVDLSAAPVSGARKAWRDYRAREAWATDQPLTIPLAAVQGDGSGGAPTVYPVGSIEVMLSDIVAWEEGWTS